MGSGNGAEVEALGPMEEPREDAFNWQEAQRQDEEEVKEIRSKKAALDKKFPAQIVARRDFLNALVKENGLSSVLALKRFST